MPQFGGTAPAMPGQVQQPGKDLKGKLQIGVLLTLLEMALPNLSDPEDKIVAEEAHLKLLKRFSKAPGDLGKAELDFMKSQAYPIARPSPMDQGQQIQSRLQGMGVQPAQAQMQGGAPVAA
jgi:hypothetical protein